MKSKLTEVIRAQHRRLLPHFCLLALAALVPSFAATITVTTTNDSGAGTLRNAIATGSSGDTINFNLPNPSTITLASPLSICNSQTLTISGPSASQLVISGNGTVQVFNICSGANVSLSGLTIEKGFTVLGGGIYNEGTLTITSATFSGNSATGSGGGIFNAGTLTMTDSTISNNSAPESCSGGQGGGVANDLGTVTLTNSTISGNFAECGGGGLSNSYGTMTLTNNTISGNSAANNPGGGVDNNTFGILLATNNTIAGNSAPAGAGFNNYGTATLKSNLFANNGSVGNCSVSGGTATSLGYNLSDDNACEFSGAGDKNSVVAGGGLDSKGLQNNGGPTQTIALLSTSPAVDAIPVADCTDTNSNKITIDQRGIARPQGTGCDIGSYELVKAVPFASFHPALAIDNGKHPGFVLTSTFTLGSGTSGLNPATESMTLTIANYTLTLPAGSFHQLWKATNAPYGYDGKVNGETVVLGLVPLDKNTFAFDTAGAPVSFPGIRNPVTVTLSFGTDTGTASVKAAITNF